VSTWTNEELQDVDSAQEMRIAGRRADGSLRSAVIVWVVRCGDDLYTRSVNGPDAAWFRGTRRRHEGHITAGDVDSDVTFVDIDPDDAIHDEIDAAYRAKYRHYTSPVNHIIGPPARATTLKIVPASDEPKDH
jgi:hypothetical protein